MRTRGGLRGARCAARVAGLSILDLGLRIADLGLRIADLMICAAELIALNLGIEVRGTMGGLRVIGDVLLFK